MKISGSYDFSAPPPAVWQALTEPESLQGCIPGCQRLEAVADGQYEAEMTIALGPIRGQFSASVGMLEQRPYEFYRLAVKGQGSSGFVNGDASVTLAPNGGGTTVQVEGDAQAGGLLARVGQRMMESVARQMMDRFFNCLGESAGQLRIRN